MSGVPELTGPARRPRVRRARQARRATSLAAHGEPSLWLTGGALAVALAMIAGLLALVVTQGATTFWPAPVVRLERGEGAAAMGEVTGEEHFLLPGAAEAGRRRHLRSGNFELTGTHYQWITDLEVRGESRPEWALVLERVSWGRFYGLPRAFLVDGEVRAAEPREIVGLLEEQHPRVLERSRRVRRLVTDGIGALNREQEQGRLASRAVELDHGEDSPEAVQARREFEALRTSAGERSEGILREIEDLERENRRYQVSLLTADGREKVVPLVEIVRAYPANRLSLAGKLRVYLSRWREFLFDDPRQANSEGGVYPAIFGTVAMTLIMALLVVPLGVLAALYLREYARPGPVVGAVRICVNNLAGVPSIVFGIFGLGFFCYLVGASIDDLLFRERLPSPTYGKGGLLWASLTLALLTLPVVIVATEEALSAVPSSMREGSYACGATKWQTIRNIVLPRAMPGIMTGMILAIARGAGEVAPLMLVGAAKVAPELPVDSVPPFLHPERSFMHLGFHIYDLGFQSQNSEAAKPMVYTTTLLLIGIVVLLNLAALWVRARLRRRFLQVQL